MGRNHIERMKEKALQRRPVAFDEALGLFDSGMKQPFHLMAAASEIREHFKGKEISLCGIVNAKSGRCPENCKFCAQSAHYSSGAPVYPLVSTAEMVENARRAVENGVRFFGIVTSGKSISAKKEWDTIREAVKLIDGLGVKVCASLGTIDRKKAAELKDAGLFRYHHNLETARSFFSNICTTHDYEEDVDAVRAAKEAGLSVCCGGLIGLGENIAHRVELAITLRELDVDSVPVNILNPIPGTPLADVPALSPLEILVTVAVYRFLLPEKDIKLCGGKEKNLRQLLPLGIVAGCNSWMTGNYLTTLGRDVYQDLEMIRDLGLKVG
ncbi:MAG TPA: biotin synthase BioB [Syntrophales bacterium]|nr:biotin synthase BioB [Syntrophales bacterium]